MPKVYYWSPNDHRGTHNFGDYLSRVIVGEILESEGVDRDSIRFTNNSEASRRLLAIGSIIHHANDQDIIWGSGVNGKELGRKPAFTELDIRLVRGPLTRAYLQSHGMDCPARFGEPGLLLSRFYDPGDIEVKYPYICIPNLNDTTFYDLTSDQIVSPTADWRTVVRKICQAEFVLSTSLHGLVLAEAYGVPARHVLSYAEPTFKYRDYYAGTGRTEVRFAQSIEEGLALGGVPEPDYDPSDLLDAFPLEYFA